MLLAKACFDIGLMIDPELFRLEDWTDDLGLALDHVIQIEGFSQYRFRIGDAVLKVNVAADALPTGPAPGFASFAIGGCRFELRHGSPIPCATQLPARSECEQPSLDVEIVSPQVDRALCFYNKVFDLERVDDKSVRCGTGRITFRTGKVQIRDAPLMGPGIRYLTLQVFNADDACSEVAAGGGRVARMPVDFGDVARYGFVLDPDGNWIELSARASVIADFRKLE